MELCAEKAKIAISKGLKVMFAIGEKKEERENGTTMEVCKSQLEPLAKAIEPKDWDCIAIAYEPGTVDWSFAYFSSYNANMTHFAWIFLSYYSLGHWNWADCYTRNGPGNPQKHSRLDFRECLSGCCVCSQDPVRRQYERS